MCDKIVELNMSSIGCIWFTKQQVQDSTRQDKIVPERDMAIIFFIFENKMGIFYSFTIGNALSWHVQLLGVRASDCDYYLKVS
jgi:hypothetical protein